MEISSLWVKSHMRRSVDFRETLNESPAHPSCASSYAQEAVELVIYFPSVCACCYCLSEARLRRCKESSLLAAIVFAPNVSRNQPHQPGGKMAVSTYWTRQVVASMGVQEMCAFPCSPNSKKPCRPSWYLSGLTSSTLKLKCKVRPKTFPAK